MSIEYPDFPREYKDDKHVRTTFLQSKANYVFYRKEIGKPVSDSALRSAMVTAATHDLSLDQSANGYLYDAINRIKDCINNVDDNNFRSSLKTVQNRLQSELNQNV